MISVVIAAYNGEKYIRQQVKSVLVQLSDKDELIISDDNIKGTTFDAVRDLVENDSRIKYVKGPSKGVIKNFEYGISLTKGDVIFLCDQDDVWLDGKVSACCSELAKGYDTVLHNAQIVDGNLNPVGRTAFDVNHTSSGFLRNYIKNTYQGSCMAFSSVIKEYILPFPDEIPMHDQWIGLMSEKYGKVSLIEQPFIFYRRHDATVTGNGSTFMQKIRWRINLLKCLLGR